MTGLMIACEAGKIEMARLLLDARADPTIKNNEGESALDLAKKGGYRDCLACRKGSGGVGRSER